MRFLADIVANILDFFFGCRHPHLTRMFTLEDETYRVCLSCGAHIHYSLATLRPLSRRQVRRMRAARAGAVHTLPASASMRQVLASSGRNHAA